MRTRPVKVDRLAVYPACCVSCAAVENSGRSFFVDLGFDIDHLFDARPDGVVYMCNECMIEYVGIFMNILEEQTRVLRDVSFGGTRTNPIFDIHREFLNEVEQRVVEIDSDIVKPEADSPLTASFGG